MTQVRETLAGRYDLVEILGRGGMGVVYRATDRVLNRSVAIKVLPVDLADDPTFVARFEREALAAAALNHSNIVAIYDSGRDENTRFIVMECVPGQSLARLLADEGCLEPREAVQIGAQIAAALAAAHRAGVIHRDIKPANVMVGEDGNVKVLDFGIARAATHTTLTQPDVILGSAPYLAPEISNGLPADARSDIYALGCVLYAMLTGDPPFTADLPAAMMHQHVTTPPRAPRELSPAIPSGLEALVLKMLAKDPAARPQQASQLVAALGASLEGPLIDTAPLARFEQPATAPTAVLKPITPGRARRRAVPLLTALAFAGLAAIVALALGGSASHSHKRALANAGTHAATHRTVTRSSSPRVSTSRTAATSTQTSPPTAAGPVTVDGASGGLASLLARDVSSGLVDPKAAGRIAGTLRDALSALSAGDQRAALNSIGVLPAQVAELQNQGGVQPAAVAPLDAAIGQLQAALEHSAGSSGGAPAGAASPGGATPSPGRGPDGAGPPGHAKDHGHGDGGGGD